MCLEPQMNDDHMATHLVRWWKTKILSGYKQFTAVLPADCGEGRPSDTEELLRSDCDPPPSTPPPPPFKPPPTPQPPSTPQPQQPTAKTELKFEGFECDVSLEGTGDPKDKQEFSFTLYDFDGHGKITKDDIAGLVTTIYDTLGSSIKVPHYGSKTIKVRLTVSPDKPTTPANAPTTPSATQQPRRYKRDLNVTIREHRGRRRPHTRRHSVSSSAASEDREADVSEEEEDVQTTPPSPHCRLGHNIHTSSCRLGNSPASLHSRSKKRSSSLQRQELLQIIQANMEKNNLCFKTSRKHYSPGRDLSRHKTAQNCWEKCGPRGRGCGEDVPPLIPPRPMPTTTSTSPHHLKHRHREQEQARAMAQVVRWLEQEFSSPRNGKKQQHNPSATERTEHHHIHEHVHHHYHHYQDTPVLV